MMRWHAVSNNDDISPWWCRLTVDNENLKQHIEWDYAPRWTAATFRSLSGLAFQWSSQLGLLTSVISFWNKWRSDEGYGVLTCISSCPSQPVVSNSVLITGKSLGRPRTEVEVIMYAWCELWVWLLSGGPSSYLWSLSHCSISKPITKKWFPGVNLGGIPPWLVVGTLEEKWVLFTFHGSQHNIKVDFWN